jgi:hypothetical protein
MEVGDLVWVRFVKVINSARMDSKSHMVWKLGVIIDNTYFDAGLYKVYIGEYDLVRKFFITDLKLVTKY